MAAQPQLAEETGSVAQTDPGAAPFNAQVSLCSQSLGLAIPQCTCATDASGKIQALRQRLQAAELGGVLVQADSLIAGKNGCRQGFGVIRDLLTYSRIGPSRSERYSI